MLGCLSPTKKSYKKGSYILNQGEYIDMLGCLSPTKKSYKKGSYILNQGEYIDFVCLIISGSVRIENIDIWGNRKIMSEQNHIKKALIY